MGIHKNTGVSHPLLYNPCCDSHKEKNEWARQLKLFRVMFNTYSQIAYVPDTPHVRYQERIQKLSPPQRE